MFKRGVHCVVVVDPNDSSVRTEVASEPCGDLAPPPAAASVGGVLLSRVQSVRTRSPLLGWSRRTSPTCSIALHCVVQGVVVTGFGFLVEAQGGQISSCTRALYPCVFRRLVKHVGTQRSGTVPKRINFGRLFFDARHVVKRPHDSRADGGARGGGEVWRTATIAKQLHRRTCRATLPSSACERAPFV